MWSYTNLGNFALFTFSKYGMIVLRKMCVTFLNKVYRSVDCRYPQVAIHENVGAIITQ